MQQNIELNSEFFQNRKYKSFIRVGQTFIDIKQTIGFNFIDDPDGYIIIQFVYDTGRALNASIKNRQEFCLFLMELDRFIDDKIALNSIESLIREIEDEFGKNEERPVYNKKKNYRKSHNKNKSNEN